ncbi:hypothetical protein MNBD_ACTINO02-1015 [hydrothermal vent metagenome]|uniref:Uncharacterized protein n=1 Tax=hydrothermal vent metagenome TaxID=652676 RepID=A0A3B0SFE2_9ZZZZ
MTTRTSRTTRLRLLSLIAVFMLVVSACVSVGDPTEFCQCPELEATAASIDWIGDDTAPDEVSRSTSVAPLELAVIVSYNTPDRTEAQAQVEERLREAGFDVVETTPFGGRIEGDEWSVHVQTSGSEEDQEVAIFVSIVDDDARAAEILAPLVDALGTLP